MNPVMVKYFFDLYTNLHEFHLISTHYMYRRNQFRVGELPDMKFMNVENIRYLGTNRQAVHQEIV